MFCACEDYEKSDTLLVLRDECRSFIVMVLPIVSTNKILTRKYSRVEEMHSLSFAFIEPFGLQD